MKIALQNRVTAFSWLTEYRPWPILSYIKWHQTKIPQRKPGKMIWRATALLGRISNKCLRAQLAFLQRALSPFGFARKTVPMVQFSLSSTLAHLGLDVQVNLLMGFLENFRSYFNSWHCSAMWLGRKTAGDNIKRMKTLMWEDFL